MLLPAPHGDMRARRHDDYFALSFTEKIMKFIKMRPGARSASGPAHSSRSSKNNTRAPACEKKKLVKSSALREGTLLAMLEIAPHFLYHDWSSTPFVASIARNQGGGHLKRPCRVLVFSGAHFVLARVFLKSRWHYHCRGYISLQLIVRLGKRHLGICYQLRSDYPPAAHL